MKERIQQIIEKEGVSAGQFADRIGVKRSTLSHILNGRNGVSTEVVNCIHLAFPSVSITWLMFGEGSMYRTQKSVYPISSQATLFDENQKIQSGVQPEVEYRKEYASIQSELVPKSNDFELDKVVSNTIVKEVLKNRRVIKIMVFYDDNTFETFSPDVLVG